MQCKSYSAYHLKCCTSRMGFFGVASKAPYFFLFMLLIGLCSEQRRSGTRVVEYLGVSLSYTESSVYRPIMRVFFMQVVLSLLSLTTVIRYESIRTMRQKQRVKIDQRSSSCVLSKNYTPACILPTLLSLTEDKRSFVGYHIFKFSLPVLTLYMKRHRHFENEVDLCHHPFTTAWEN